MKKVLHNKAQIFTRSIKLQFNPIVAGINLFSTFSRVLFVLLVFINFDSTAQTVVQGASDSGSIILTKGMPKLELRVLNNTPVSSDIYPGMRFRMDLLIKNNGRETAQECQLMVESTNPLLTAGIPDWYPFDLEPGDSITRTVELQTDRNAMTGDAMVTLSIREKNGYDLFPARIVNFKITEPPAARVVVTDYAVRDQRGVEYFDQFEDVQLFFRIQNCGFQPIHNVSARIELKPGVIARQLNPNFAIGSLQPGQFRDINAMVSTEVMSENISLDIHLTHESNTSVQSFQLNFRQDYKTPERLSADKCSQLMASVPGNDSGSAIPDRLPAKSSQSGKYAIIIVNKNYYSLEPIDHALTDAGMFISRLKTHLGFQDDNIITVPNITHETFDVLKDVEQFNNWKRNWRRTNQQVELVFYYIGYGAVDHYNGNLYLLPVNFSPFRFQSRIDAMEVYNWLFEWKQQYRLNHVSVFMNIKNTEKSKWGQKHASEFKIVKAHHDLPGFSSLISSSFQQSSHFSGTGQASLFTEFVLKGLDGKADYNRDQYITISELYRFISDELQGIPAKAWDVHNSFSVPVFLGEEHVLY